MSAGGSLSLAAAFEVRFDEDRGCFGIDCIAVTAQSSHAGGSPISQRECAGFNWPPLSVPAVEPINISPEAVSRAGPVIAAACAKSCGLPFRSISERLPSSVRTFFSPSAWRVVGHPAMFPASVSVMKVWPLYPYDRLPALSCTVAVGHPAKFACLGNWSSLSVPSSLGLMSAPESFQSRLVAVTQPARVATCGRATATFRPSGVLPVALLSLIHI